MPENAFITCLETGVLPLAFIKNKKNRSIFFYFYKYVNI